MEISVPFGSQLNPLQMPDDTYVVHMHPARALNHPETFIQEALVHPISSLPLCDIARAKAKGKNHPTATVIVSDLTRPVPYKGQQGILLPILETLIENGYEASDILVLIANGTHRAMTEGEILQMLGQEVLDLGVQVANHDCHDESMLTFLGKTKRGTEAWVDSRYVRADLKIATGLVESHFMAGASGGRKAVCPGIAGIRTTLVFHGPELMANANSRDLLIKGNPVHEESLAVAKMAGVDFLANVTLDGNFKITGVFFGDLEKAHEKAVDFLKEQVISKCPQQYDVVVTHGGFVGVNHYQCAKCGVASLGILKEGGYLVILADTTDQKNPVGGESYQKALRVMVQKGADGFLKAITSPDWSFLPEQWQVQQWCKVFKRIPMDHCYLASPQLKNANWKDLPGINGAKFSAEEKPGTDWYKQVLEAILADIAKRSGNNHPSMAWIADGPYVIPAC